MPIIQKLHKTFNACAIKEATITLIGGAQYQYVNLSPKEFQFGPVGNVLTNYVAKEKK